MSHTVFVLFHVLARVHSGQVPGGPAAGRGKPRQGSNARGASQHPGFPSWAVASADQLAFEASISQISTGSAGTFRHRPRTVGVRCRRAPRIFRRKKRRAALGREQRRVARVQRAPRRGVGGFAERARHLGEVEQRDERLRLGPVQLLLLVRRRDVAVQPPSASFFAFLLLQETRGARRRAWGRRGGFAGARPRREAFRMASRSASVTTPLRFFSACSRARGGNALGCRHSGDQLVRLRQERRVRPI